MESEKLEDLLLLSLSASKGQRERSEVLDVGVTRDKNLREVIVKYSGDIDGLQIPGMEIQKLLAGYAIVKLPEDQIGALVSAREIEYVEMPKNLQSGQCSAQAPAPRPGFLPAAPRQSVPVKTPVPVPDPTKPESGCCHLPFENPASDNRSRNPRQRSTHLFHPGIHPHLSAKEAAKYS